MHSSSSIVVVFFSFCFVLGDCSRVILRGYSWICTQVTPLKMSGDHIGYLGSNYSKSHAGQMPYPLSYLSSVRPIYSFFRLFFSYDLLHLLGSWSGKRGLNACIYKLLLIYPKGQISIHVIQKKYCLFIYLLRISFFLSNFVPTF